MSGNGEKHMKREKNLFPLEFSEKLMKMEKNLGAVFKDMLFIYNLKESSATTLNSDFHRHYKRH